MSQDESDLEKHLREAPIDVTGVFGGGGGHPGKQLVVVRGGVGAIAKLAHHDHERQMVRAEAGTYLLARELGWDDLVPVTVIRDVPLHQEAATVEASVQVLWPTFTIGLLLSVEADALPEKDTSRAAVIDALIRNSDRHRENWGLIADRKLGLIDHGHAIFPPLAGVNSPFVTRWSNEPIPPEHLVRLQEFVDRDGGRINECISGEPLKQIVERAKGLLADGILRADG